MNNSKENNYKTTKIQNLLTQLNYLTNFYLIFLTVLDIFSELLLDAMNDISHTYNDAI